MQEEQGFVKRIKRSWREFSIDPSYWMNQKLNSLFDTGLKRLVFFIVVVLIAVTVGYFAVRHHYTEGCGRFQHTPVMEVPAGCAGRVNLFH